VLGNKTSFRYISIHAGNFPYFTILHTHIHVISSGSDIAVVKEMEAMEMKENEKDAEAYNLTIPKKKLKY
jgi:diadenosine tetraphosphate (Ap4A) HIT family hydrolase